MSAATDMDKWDQGRSKCMTKMWDQLYRKWRLESILNRTLLTTVPSTRISGHSGTPWWFDGILQCRWGSADGQSNTVKTVIPQSRLKKYLEIFMEDMGGHLGRNKFLDKVREQYYWLHMRSDVESWCQLCYICTAS
jgi:hypothetical protein